MAAFIKENTQFYDEITGKPLVGGSLYIGANGSDPVVTAVSTTIFADRALTIPLANPQTLNSFGESTVKIWIDGRYSMQVNDVNSNQKFQDLDAGETPESGITTLSNVQGINIITAEAATTITAYVDLELYTFTVASTNTGAVTLNIDGVGASPIVKNGSVAIDPGDFIAGSNVVVSRNEGNGNFDWVNQVTGAPELEITTGDVKLTYKTVPDSGYVLADDGSIGNATSSASNRANADTSALFTLLYDNMSDAECPVSGGRGANAAADFAADKNLTIPITLGHAIGIAGAGSGLTARTLGDTVGEETHAQTIAEIAAHTHTKGVNLTANVAGTDNSILNHPTASNTGSTGSGTAFNVVQPTSFMNIMIKL